MKMLKRDFCELIEDSCSIVKEKILSSKEGPFKVIPDKVGKNNQIHLSLEKIHPSSLNHPCLYRWLVSENSEVMRKLNEYSKSFPKLKELLNQLEVLTIEDNKYYPIYFGKSENGKKRIINQHLNGTVRTSTIRHTLYGLFWGDYTTDRKSDLADLFLNSYFEVVLFADDCKEHVVPLEAICIALGKYPLNIEGNLSVDDNWYSKLMEARKISKKPKNKKISSNLN